MAIYDFSREELKELSKVIDIDKSDSASYEIDGNIHSMYQRNEHGYRIKIKNDNKIWMFIFQGKKLKYLLPAKKISIFKKMINSLSRKRR